MEQITIAGTNLILDEGDITQAETQAIVNAANSRLAGGGGVDGAIHRAGGPSIMKECRQFGGCATGWAVMTGAGKLRAEKVIHTVGPIYRNGPDDAKLLASCYKNSLKLAIQAGLSSVAFPSISTGAYGYPLDEAAGVALGAVRESLEENPGALDEVRFVLFGSQAFKAYSRALKNLP